MKSDEALKLVINTIGIRKILIDAYLDFKCDYLTTEYYSEANGLTFEQGQKFIDLARQVYYSQHPEA